METRHIVNIALAVLHIVGMWAVFVKAGKPGWAAIIPIYNFFVLMDVAGKPWWWALLMLVPVVNIVIMILTAIAVAHAFARSTLFGVCLAVLGPIFFPILGFGGAKYVGPAAPRAA